MSGWLACSVVLVAALVVVALLCWRLSRVHLQLAAAYRTISAMLDDPAGAERAAAEHAEEYGFGEGP